MRPLTARNVALLLVAALLGGLIGYWLSTRGQAPEVDYPPNQDGFYTVAWTEPYGGCKEASRYVGTSGWWSCLHHNGSVGPWREMTPLFADILRHHYRQVGINERWKRCAYRFRNGTTVVLCPSGNRYTS